MAHKFGDYDVEMNGQSYTLSIYSDRIYWNMRGTITPHRTDGPAIEWVGGTQEWMQNGLLHREDGPALITTQSKQWFKEGKRHREDGPAIEYANGDKRWYLDGAVLTEKEFLSVTATCDGKIVEIGGRKYQLTLV